MNNKHNQKHIQMKFLSLILALLLILVFSVDAEIKKRYQHPAVQLIL